MARPKRKPVRRITRRWLLNSFVVIVGIVLLIEIIAGYTIQRYYYNQVEQVLSNRIDIIRNDFSQMALDPSAGAIEDQIQEYVADFDQRDRMDLMIIDMNRNITATSSGFMPQSRALPDVDAALLDTSVPGKYIGKLGTNEKVYAVASLSPFPEQTVRDSSVLAVRLVTSLTQVDKQIFGTIAMLAALGIVALGLVLFSSFYFLNSIIRPIGEVGETARLIAQGNLEARLEKKTDDEIGELADMINYMAGELETAEHLKNDFISSVSHELRTPLTAIQGWAETLRGDAGEDTELRNKGMDIIIGETKRLSDMVEELLDFSRMQSGRLKLIRTRTDVLAELSEAVLMYTQRAQREGIALVYQEPNEVVMVYGDKNRLRQVFINIIDNAIKYSDSGDQIEITTDIQPDTIKITIKDTGIGISEKDLPQIKDRFYKASSTRRGSGIGLAVADEIILRHDGTLDVSSQKGQGTTITIGLPIYQKQDDITQVDDISPDFDETTL